MPSIWRANVLQDPMYRRPRWGKFEIIVLVLQALSHRCCCGPDDEGGGGVREAKVTFRKCVAKSVEKQ
jgi:hypothetical protein